MPELPDVEVLKQYIDATSLHKKISSVIIKSGKILKGISSKRLKKSLEGNSLESTKRHGKYLFVRLNSGEWLVLHFGMTGDLKYYKGEGKAIPYHQILFNFNGDYHLAYISRRMLGKVGVLEDIEKFITGKKLGPDALDLGFKEFKKIINRGRGSIKSTLMNQKLMAGIGNIYSDEILFQAKIHPASDVGSLSGDNLKKIFQNMKSVIRMAIKRRADPEKFPSSYLLNQRHNGGKCPKCGGAVERIKISGRSAYYCPKCQGKY
jgi:formamidopyrimidine-DNA glycosylase